VGSRLARNRFQAGHPVRLETEQKRTRTGRPVKRPLHQKGVHPDMATFSVSNSSQLKSALGRAHGGDTIKLAGGSYGSLSLSNKFNGNVTIKSDGNAKFSTMTLNSAANLTLDNITFAGSGTGLKANGGTNITVNNCDFRDLSYGASFMKVAGLKVTNNYATEMVYDAFRFAGVNNVTISGNTYQERGSKAGPNHKDFIQFWTESAGPSKNITITGNKFYSDDNSTHGIFMNGDNYSGGSFQNVYIANNYFKSSHTHGITVAHGNDVEIRNNTLIQDGRYPPLINVTPDSKYVKIIGNTAPSVPNEGNSTWDVSGNRETGRGTHWTGGMNGSPISNTGSSAGAADDDGAGGTTGTSGSDTLVGTSGGDTLRGLGGNDVLKGAGGSDILIGGAGGDRFDFDRLSDSAAARDVIRAGDGASAFQGAGSAGGDRIDVSGIDANVGAGGNQAFHFGGTGRGDLSVVESNGDTLVRANVDGDGGFELALLIDDGAVRASAYSAADFIL
jgi:hypothetical protein